MNKKFQTDRPLLNVQRFEVRQFVVFWKLPIYPDQSNQKTNILRNKVRKQIMPTLRTFFNPQIDFALINFTKITSDEQLYFLNILNSLLKIKKSYPRFVFFVFTFSYFFPFTHASVSAQSKGTRIVVLIKANPFAPRVLLRVPCLLSSPLVSGHTATPSVKRPLPLVSEASTGGNSGLFTPKTGMKSKQNSILAMFTKRNSFFWDTKKLWRERKRLTKSVLFFRKEKSCYPFSKVTCFPFPSPSVREAKGREATTTALKVRGLLASLSVKHSTRSKQQHNFSFLTNEKSNCENVLLCEASTRNKIIYELVVKDGTINTFYSYPLVFQKRILKQLLKTLPLVENTLIKKDKRKLTQLLIINHIEKLLTQKEKKALLIVILKTINKHLTPYS